ncbi:MFS general substrate transporter [Lindgomyces ingoldianus]|uniref:MFS general substrate transporter n=1 Tax=Lindgomyces ingoldianus TaxID=673940 RepID=A0ACB6RAR9_9PLEO|nr:MFS general substrate transporter [Lindgomyces ingoldianus]KAF2475445.1 MFS general substrate transporter [Lindgomyces ingoldianus]
MEQDTKPEVVDDNLIDFDGPDDPYLPLNWPFRHKVVVTLLYSLCTMGTTWASTVYNSGLSQVQEQFHVGNEVALLGMALYLAGNAFGPLLWAPMSEAYGRKLSVLIPIFGLMVFSFASAVAKDLQTLLIARFFGGVFGGAPLSNVGGVLADIWPPTQRGAALLFWGMAVIVGPLLAPIVGGALVIALPHTGWRWTGYLTGTMLAAILVASMLWIDESFPPVLLARKANKIRLETKNWAIHSKSQETGTSFKEMSRKYLIVPFEMLIDPIAFFINLYAAFCYAIVYLAVIAFPIEFQAVRRWNEVVGSLPFLAMTAGVLIAACINFWGQLYYRKRFIANGNKLVPEARLMPMIIGSFFFPAGLFIMGWTAKKDIHWIGFSIGGACVGFGFFTIFQSAISYLVDTYLMLAASALAANMFMRSILAAAFPLFAKALFDKLGLDWGMSLLGFIAVAMIPIPFLFYIFGKRIRAVGKRSKQTFIP